MDCGIFSDFVLERMVMIWENSSKMPRYLDLIHFPQPVRPICPSPDIGNAEGGERLKDREEETCGKGGRRGWVRVSHF